MADKSWADELRDLIEARRKNPIVETMEHAADSAAMTLMECVVGDENEDVSIFLDGDDNE